MLPRFNFQESLRPPANSLLLRLPILFVETFTAGDQFTHPVTRPALRSKNEAEFIRRIRRMGVLQGACKVVQLVLRPASFRARCG